MWCLEFFEKKWNMYEGHIFPRPLQQTCRLETTPLCLHTPLSVKKNFEIHINFIEINVNVCLLCAPHVMKSIILHNRRPVNKMFVTHLVFIFQLTFIFRILKSWKAHFHITPFRPTSYVLMRLMWLEYSNRVRNWNKVRNFIFVESKLELCQLEMLMFVYKLMCQISLINLFHFCSVNLIM